MVKLGVSIVGVFGVAAVVLGQSEVYFEIADDTLLPGESTSLTLWAAFPRSDHSLAGILTSVHSSTGAEGLSDLRLIPTLDGPGTTAGMLTPAGVEGIIAGQLMFPVCGIGGCPPSINPVAFWEATYTAPLDASPMDIELSTLTTRFDVYPEVLVTRSESRLDGLIEGSATIRVVPAPAGMAVFGVGAMLVVRRRR